MIKNVISNTGGIGLYGVVSICLFITVFTGAIIRALRLKKSFVKTMSRLPLEDGAMAPPAKGNSHE